MMSVGSAERSVEEQEKDVKALEFWNETWEPSVIKRKSTTYFEQTARELGGFARLEWNDVKKELEK